MYISCIYIYIYMYIYRLCIDIDRYIQIYIYIYIYIHLYSKHQKKWYLSSHSPFIIQLLVVNTKEIFEKTSSVEWWLERYRFCDACCSWTKSADELFLERNVSATICSWPVRHDTALIVFNILHLRLLLRANNSVAEC